MDATYPSAFAFFRKSFCSVGLVMLSYHYAVIAPYVAYVLPWGLFACGVIGILSVIVLLTSGPLQVDYGRGFVLCSRIPSPVLAEFCMQCYARGFWLLQAVEVLEDAHADTPRARADGEPPNHSGFVIREEFRPWGKTPSEEREGRFPEE